MLKILITIFSYIILIVIALTLATGIFIGIGYGISLIVPLTLFQASLLSMGATLVIVAIFFGVTLVNYLDRVPYFEDDEYEDFDDENDIEGAVVGALPFFLRSEKVGRNALCPCGSGKKFKNCCGKVPQ